MTITPAIKGQITKALTEQARVMRERLLGIERDLIEAISDARTLEPHDENWRSFVTRLDSAKSAIWHAMDEQPQWENR